MYMAIDHFISSPEVDRFLDKLNNIVNMKKALL